VVIRTESSKRTLFRWSQTLIGLIVALIPIWLYILANFVFSPEGFWQKIVLGAVCLFFLSGFQIVLLVLFIVWLSVVWD